MTETAEPEVVETEELSDVDQLRKKLEEANAKLDNFNRRDKYLRECHAKCAECRESVEEIESDMNQLKKALKTAESAYETARNELQQAVADHRIGQNQLPFPDDCTDSEDGTPVDVGGIQKLDEISAEIDGKTWKLSARALDCLEEREITEVAHLEKFIREDAVWHTKIDGVGPASVDKVTELILQWRQKYPVPVEEDDDEPEEDQEIPPEAWPMVPLKFPVKED